MITATQSRIIRQTADATFFETMNARRPSIDVAPFASTKNTNKIQMDFGHFGAVPFPTEWLGMRQHRAIKAWTSTITPRKWELTIDFDVRTFNEDQTGTIKERSASLASRCQEFYVKRWTQVIEAGTGTTLGTPYDGVSIINDAHAESGTSQDNSFTSAAATGTQPTAAELEASLDADIQVMTAYTDDQGIPYSSSTDGFVLMVGPNLQVIAAKVLNANGTLGNGQPGGFGRSDSAVAEGTFRGTIKYFVNNYLATYSDRAYLLRTLEGSPGPTVLVQSDPWEFSVQDKTSHVGFESDVISFGGRGIFEFGYADWRAIGLHVWT